MIIVTFWKYNFDKIPKVKWLEFLGNISFEFYIVQHVALLAFRPVFVHPVFYLIITLLSTVIIAWILNKYVTAKFLYL